MRYLIATALYVLAFFMFWSAINIAPDMKWPVTDTEWMAINLLILGIVCKFAGHIVMWPSR